MYLSVPMIFLAIIVISWCCRDEVAGEILAEMKDPGGRKRQATIDAKLANRAARAAGKAAWRAKHAQGIAIAWGVSAFAVLLGAICCYAGAIGLGLVLGFMMTVPVVAVAMCLLGKIDWIKVLYALVGVAVVAFVIAALQCLIVVIKNS